MGSQYAAAFVTLLLSTLVAFVWALLVFYTGASIPPDDVDWYRVARVLSVCLTAFVLFSVSTLIPVRPAVGTKLALGFGLVFAGAWQNLLDNLVVNYWALAFWLEAVAAPVGLLVASLGLYQLGKSYRRCRLRLLGYRKVERELATRDPVTRLYNRRSFFAICSDLMTQVSDKTHHHVICFRLDNLTEINRALGFGAGDQALQQMGKLISRQARPEDIGARLSARRLALFLPNAERTLAEQTAQEVVRRAKHMALRDEQDREVPQGLKVQAKLETAEPGESLENLLCRAGGIQCH